MGKLRRSQRTEMLLQQVIMIDKIGVTKVNVLIIIGGKVAGK